ncbi:Nematode cuticle collagen and Collagen triple helix repeat domain containing protein [Aphelenchoides fujianensis]|nr:Nematode cuticle collagen and Collagen triple helix repeat domain containing protein [Aphelenchoides fujianensis]
MEGLLRKDEHESFEHKEARFFAFWSIVISTACLVVIVVSVPVMFTTLHGFNADLELKADFCKVRVRDVWHELYALGRDGRLPKARVQRERRGADGQWIFGQFIPNRPQAQAAPVVIGRVESPTLGVVVAKDPTDVAAATDEAAASFEDRSDENANSLEANGENKEEGEEKEVEEEETEAPTTSSTTTTTKKTTTKKAATTTAKPKASKQSGSSGTYGEAEASSGYEGGFKVPSQCGCESPETTERTGKTERPAAEETTAATDRCWPPTSRSTSPASSVRWVRLDCPACKDQKGRQDRAVPTGLTEWMANAESPAWLGRPVHPGRRAALDPLESRASPAACCESKGHAGPRASRGLKASIRGLPGCQGEIGGTVPGAKGERGDSGRPGRDGRRGNPGEPGTSGVRGISGDCSHCPPPRLPPNF